MSSRQYILISYEGVPSPALRRVLHELQGVLHQERPANIAVRTLNEQDFVTSRELVAFLERRAHAEARAVGHRVFSQLLTAVSEDKIDLVVMCTQCHHLSRGCTCNLMLEGRLQFWRIQKESLRQNLDRTQRGRNLGPGAKEIVRAWVNQF